MTAKEARETAQKATAVVEQYKEVQARIEEFAERGELKVHYYPYKLLPQVKSMLESQGFVVEPNEKGKGPGGEDAHVISW